MDFLAATDQHSQWSGCNLKIKDWTEVNNIFESNSYKTKQDKFLNHHQEQASNPFIQQCEFL